MIPLFDDVRSSRFPYVNYLIIGLNFLVFAYELSIGERVDVFIGRWAMTPSDIVSQPSLPVLTTTVTSMFLHAGWQHLLGNMLFLWVFGDNVEDSMGHLRYVFFYLIAGIVAASAQILMAPDSPLPSIGASGAISGVLGAYMLLYPRARVLTWVPVLIFLVIRLPAVVFLGIWFLFQFITGLATANDATMGGVAWWAHIGGFLAGMLLINIFRQRPRYRVISY